MGVGGSLDLYCMGPFGISIPHPNLLDLRENMASSKGNWLISASSLFHSDTLEDLLDRPCASDFGLLPSPAAKSPDR